MTEDKKLSFNIKAVPFERYFQDLDDLKDFNENYRRGLLTHVSGELRKELADSEFSISYDDTSFEVVVDKIAKTGELNDFINRQMRYYYEKNQVHITRMFGSYVLITGNEEKLEAVKATPIPIKHCPLMVKLLKEVGGETAESLLKTLQDNNPVFQAKAMCRLINEVVIKGGYFDTNRPLNSCEANVLFGASETMASAFEAGLIDAAVIVSNNLGTIITTNASNTQGAVKRMTGLFYTSPSEKIMQTAIDAEIIPVFPYLANIDQVFGVKKAIDLGYKNIAVSVAASENYLHGKMKELEKKHGVKIYKFGLCSTGISEEVANIMKDNADVVWSCASKYVKELIAPNSVAQVGAKIPVHVMNEQGWEIIKNHLQKIEGNIDFDKVKLSKSGDKPIFLREEQGIKQVEQKDISKCIDCPHPCI